ncbi:restriction endonuclease subunit S [Ketogulonicigenium vulgare]|uniref:restriction endonuclease subunit S n=1 Tax=Ketogulonicigenium vulgare TaxID=92945 RepID=UPI0023593E80|nr:restriction endonuclease subunit S [Ketogulonicigenium vulgare]
MTDWRATSLGEICRFQAGDAFPKELQGAATGDVPVVKVSDMNLSGNELFISHANNWLSTPEVERDFKLHTVGAVIFAKIGVALTSNRRRILLRPTVIDNNMMSAVCTSDVDPRWFYYLLTTLDFNEVASGSALPYLTVRDLNKIAVFVPPLPEQRAIAATLGALDDKIELNRKMNATLEAMARALFRDWFVDFGPTRAKMEARAPYLFPDLWSLLPDRLDDEGKPEGWEASTIGDEVRVVGGSTPSTKEPDLWDGGINWATPKDLSALAAPVLLETSRTISAAGLAKISSGLLPVGSLLLSSRAPIGYLAITEVPVAINQGFIGMICDKRVSNVFAWLWTLENMEAILAKANGSTFQEISKGNFRPLPVVVPSTPVMHAFDAIAQPLYERIAKNERESRTLAQTRDLLLPRLMSGQILLHPDAMAG